MPNISLNFSKSDKESLLKLLKQFPPVKTTAAFESYRCRIGDSTVTLYDTGKVSIQGNDSEKSKQLLLNGLHLGQKIVLGLDEVGRSELHGAFVIAGVLGDENQLRELRDSKKTSNVEEKFSIASKNSLSQVIVSLNAEYVDLLRKRGLNLNEIESHIANAVVQLFDSLEENASIKMDGTPLKGANPRIEFIVQGDDLNPVIGSASVVAKFFRERSADSKKRETWSNSDKMKE